MRARASDVTVATGFGSVARQQATTDASLRGSVLWLVPLIALAAVLRFYNLGQWGLEGDEIFTLRDSLDLRPDNPRPLMYLLNHYLVLPFRPLDEFGLRLLPAIFGVLAIPTLYLVARRLIGHRPALIATFLLAVSGLHVYHSQYARYWSLVFLLSAIYPFALYLAIRDRDFRWGALGLVAGFLAMLSHPASVLLLGGLGLWLVATYARPDVLLRFWRQPAGRWAAFAMAVIGVVIAIRYVPMLSEWVAARDATPTGGGEHLMHLPKGAGRKQIAFLLSYVEGLSLPLALTGLIGIYLLWIKRDRQLAVLLLCVVAFPTLFLALVSLRTAVSTSYLLATTPVVFIAAGVFIDWLIGLDQQLRPRWLLPATIMTLVVLPGVPTLLSQYRDGRRHDFRKAAQWLDTHSGTADLVFSDQYQVLAHYLPEDRPVERLNADTSRLETSVTAERSAGRPVWIVVPGTSHGFRTNSQMGSLMGWIYAHCQLRNTVGTSRLDFRQYLLQIYRCPPTEAPVGAGIATSGSRATPE